MFEAESSQRGDDGEGRVREDLGKQFIAALGGLGRVLAMAAQAGDVTANDADTQPNGQSAAA